MNVMATLGRIGRRALAARALYSALAPSGRAAVLAQIPNNAVCLEIGVDRGDFSAAILATGRVRQLHLVDPWKYYPDPSYQNSRYGGEVGHSQAHMDEVYARILERFAGEIRTGTVVVHRGASQDVAKEFSDASVHWVYVDGNHLEEYVAADLELFYAKLRRGGMLCGDDYNVEGWWRNGVTKAVDKFVLDHRLSARIYGDQFIIGKS